jgi:hypothetical protein
MKTIWIAKIPDIFGYGLIVAEVSEDKAMKALKKDKAMKALKKAFYEWRNSRGSTTTFKEALENWGGGAEEISIGKVYYDNFQY